MNKDHAYHQIALACLKALRHSSAASSENLADSLYDAIDQAFSEQFALVLMELEESQTRLKAIAALNTERHTIEDAKKLAVTTSRPH